MKKRSEQSQAAVIKYQLHKMQTANIHEKWRLEKIQDPDVHEKQELVFVESRIRYFREILQKLNGDRSLENCLAVVPEELLQQIDYEYE